MKTAEETLAGLVDREEIRDLPARYCDCVWRGDVAGIVELFTVDGSFTVKAPDGENIHTGREGLLKMYTEGLRKLRPRPYIHNHVVELGYDGRATGRCYLDLRSEQRNMEWIGAGYYDDEYVKVGDRWKFASRYFTVLRLDSAPAKSASKPRPVRVAEATPKSGKAKVAAHRKTAPAKRNPGADKGRLSPRYNRIESLASCDGAPRKLSSASCRRSANTSPADAIEPA